MTTKKVIALRHRLNDQTWKDDGGIVYWARLPASRNLVVDPKLFALAGPGYELDNPECQQEVFDKGWDGTLPPFEEVHAVLATESLLRPQPRSA